MRNFRRKPLIFTLVTALKMNAQTPIQAPRQLSVPIQMSADTTLRFDVLSVRLTVPGANPLEHRQIRNTDPGRVHYVNVGLKDIMMNAYTLREYQVSAPDWLNMISVDVDATMAAGTTKETREPRDSPEPTADECWNRGILYYNRNDAALMVETREGAGVTINFGNPWSWALACLLAINVADLFLFPALRTL